MSETLVPTQLLIRAESSFSQLRQEFESWKIHFNVQPEAVQHFLRVQAQRIVEGLTLNAAQIRFSLPDQILCQVKKTGEVLTVRVPEKYREQRIGSFWTRLRHVDRKAVLQRHLTQLEGSSNPGVSFGAALIRYSTTTYILHDFLPSGRFDTIHTEMLPATLSPAAHRFCLPEWAAFDESGNLLVDSLAEAEGRITSMQRAIGLLDLATSLSPYMVADEAYQKRRYGLSSQLVQQGRALACDQTQQIIRGIQQRAAAHRLDRGFSLSLPYFDDQGLEMKTHNFVVIPAGRVLFSPAFVALAAWKEQVRVAQDTRLNPTTRNHLVGEIRALEEAFYTPELEVRE
jgi:hypothetical protein